MERLSEIIANTNEYILLLCITYSFFCGTIFPEIWDQFYDRKRLNRSAIIQLARALGSWGLTIVIGTLPGTIMAWASHRDYGGASLLLFFIGWGVRRILHESKIWRGPPWF
jgi:hypothetical protein